MSCNDCHVVNVNEYLAPYFGVSGCFGTLNWCCVSHTMSECLCNYKVRNVGFLDLCWWVSLIWCVGSSSLVYFVIPVDLFDLIGRETCGADGVCASFCVW